MRWQGFALGFLGLTLAETVLSSKTASGRVGGLLAALGSMAEWFINPATPAFGSAKSTTSTTTPPPAASAPPPSSIPV